MHLHLILERMSWKPLPGLVIVLCFHAKICCFVLGEETNVCMYLEMVPFNGCECFYQSSSLNSDGKA